MEDDARATILEIYRQRSEIIAANGRPERVVMSMARYRLIQEFHAHLGELPDGAIDYIARYRIFDLEICIDAEEPDVRVE